MINIDRRKLPVLALGRTEPLGYGRGFRIISGMIDYVVLQNDLLKEIYDDSDKKISEIILANDEYETWNPIENAFYNETSDNDKSVDIGGAKYYKIMPTTLDMLPPLDIIVYGVDENGEPSGMIITGLEFTSSSLVATINDVALAQRAEFVAKSVTPWMKG
jgi:hypothetical protein